MQKRIGISAFFPCYNDAGTIASLVTLADLTLRELTDDYEIIVIDDASTDHSRQIIQELSGKYDRLKVVFHEKNKGYGGALLSGFRSSIKDWVFYTDGDFQYDVSEVLKFAELIGDDVDVINGYKIVRSDPIYRKIIGKTYHWLMKAMFRFKIRDVDCDFRIIRKTALDSLDLKYHSGVICIELVKKLQMAGCRFVEVPVHHYYRVYGKSQFFNFVRLLQVGKDIFRLWWELVFKEHLSKHHAQKNRGIQE